MVKRIALIVAAMLGAAPGQSQAPSAKPIAAAPEAAFEHVPSGLTLPVRLDGLPRTQVMEFEAPQADIFATYRPANDTSELTVFIYHATSGSVPVWFDRAMWAVEDRKAFGTPVRLDRPLALAGRSESGMLAAWALSGSQYRGTALALTKIGPWLVKLRYSSRQLDAAALHDRLTRVVEALNLPTTEAPAPMAAVLPCEDTLATNGTASTVKPDTANALVAALVASAAALSDKTTANDAAATWCRDATRVPIGAVYRASGAKDAYLVALSDAGRGIFVTPSLDKTKPSVWNVSVILPGRTLTYTGRDRLPAPEQALQIVREPPQASVVTIGDQRTVSINRGAVR